MALGHAFVFLPYSCSGVDVHGSRGRSALLCLHRRRHWIRNLIGAGDFFGHNASQRVVPEPVSEEGEDIKLTKLRNAEEARHSREMEKLIGSYEYSRAGSRSSRAPASLHCSRRDSHSPSHSSWLSGGSLYSQVTGCDVTRPNIVNPSRIFCHPGCLGTFNSSISVYRVYGGGQARQGSPHSIRLE
jgi:hypothetical protein